MAIGFPARVASSRTYFLPEDELAAVVKYTLESLGWSYTVLSDGGFLAAVPFGGGTWGEDFHVRILPGGVIEAESKCKTVRLPQVFDFGKNRKNVETFFALAEHSIRQGFDPNPVNATGQGSVAQAIRETRKTSWAATLLGGCLIATIGLGILIYFISAAIGLFTGQLYLPGRGHSGMVYGVWARIISAIILMIFTWIVISALRSRRKRQR